VIPLLFIKDINMQQARNLQKKITSFIESKTPLLPVVTIESIEDAIPIADALYLGGVQAMEVTLRTAAGLPALKLLREQRPNLFLCAGSVSTTSQLSQVAEVGVDLAVTPGISKNLLDTAGELGISILPGASNPSDILLGMEYGLSYFKFFPAQALGGLNFLQALAEPFPDLQFCPTGGINPENIRGYLGSRYVAFVGGSWLTPKDKIKEGNWAFISDQARRALAVAKQV
jgi:2-dehydro-3-deoxyphosphogluconate aldolase/(4S)-4-hydroxy-2-oxoglutarate aldolase